jgi:V8-like Glu-specific endopeptidase
MKSFIFSLFLCIVALSAFSQVEKRYYPEKNALDSIPFLKGLISERNYVNMPSFDLERLKKEDKELEGLDIPYRFGKGFEVSYTLDDGNWIECDNGRLWSKSFKSNGALSLNFVFENFHLSDECCLYIVNKDRSTLYGPVKKNAIPDNGFFLTDIIPGDFATIVLYEPFTQRGKCNLCIKKIVHGYRSAFSQMQHREIGDSEDCNNDVICFPEYEKESNAIALVLLESGEEWCTGSLLMSTDYSFKSYFLTAFHCIDTYPNGDLSTSEKEAAQKWLFLFQYKKTTCNGISYSNGVSYNGDYFRAAFYKTDFALLELKQNLSSNTSLTWLGWDKSGQTPTSGVGIHHPQGDLMKISFDYDPFLSYSNLGGTNNFWLLSYDDGVVEHGSSGSPILNENKRVVGQLYGNSYYNSNLLYCSQPRAEYGKFNLSWTGDDSNDTRLSNWLDPLGTNQTTIDGFKPSDIFVSGKTVLCDTANYVIIGLPSGFTINWNIDNSNFSISPSGYQCLVTYSGTQQYTVANLTANVKWNGATIKTLTKRIVMYGTDLVVYGEQDSYVSPNGIFPYRQFTIPANNGLRMMLDSLNKEELTSKESLPIKFIEDNTRDLIHPPVDLCGYGITEINGGNMVYLSSDRFEGMDIWFSGYYSPTYLYHSENSCYVSFQMPYYPTEYPMTLHAESDGGCHDFCLTFKVVPLPGASSGDDEIWVNLDGSMLYVNFLPVDNMSSYSVTISKIPAGTQVYSNTFPGTQSYFSVNTSSWTSGIYSIRIVQGNNIYTKSIYI